MAFNPSEIAEIAVNGMRYRDWETVQVKHQVYAPSFTARFTCSEETPYAKDCFAAVHESTIGTKRTFNRRAPMSPFGGKADISGC